MNGVQLTLDLGTAKRFYHNQPMEPLVKVDERVIEFGGSNVLYTRETVVLGINFLISSIRVQGYISGEYKKIVPGEKVPVTDIIPITDESGRQELTDILKDREETAYVSFLE